MTATAEKWQKEKLAQAAAAPSAKRVKKEKVSGETRKPGVFMCC